MTTLRTTCPVCGEIDVPASTAILDAETRSWSFECPRCRDVLTKPTDEAIWDLLVATDIGTFSQAVDRFLDETRDSS